ncbi:hypothetical protein [Mycolicibacterium sp. XJ775]
MKRLGALFLVAALAAAGCISCKQSNPENLQTAGAGWPSDLSDFTINWTADKGIDLVHDGAAIATRAYVESYYLASITEDETYLYPGFAEAVEPNQSASRPLGRSHLHPQVGISPAAIWVGTARHRVLRLDRLGDDVTAVVCAYLYGSAGTIPAAEGYFVNVGIGDEFNPGIFPMRVGLRAPDDSTKLLSQKGPSKAPFQDVFGGWKITSFLFDYFTQPASWPEKGSDLASCIARDERPAENTHFERDKSYPRSAFPTLPSVPGWPEKPVLN